MEILSDKIVTARRSHVCFACCEPIQAGERYRLTSLADGGRAWSTKEHMGCAELMMGIDYDSDIGYSEGALLEHVGEYTDEDMQVWVTDAEEQQRLIALRNSMETEG